MTTMKELARVRTHAPLALGFLLAGVMLALLGKPPERKAEEFGLDKGTSGYRASYRGRPVNASDDGDAIDRMLAGRAERGSKPFALLLGNSQLDSINQRKEDVDRNAPDLLFEARDRIGLEVLTINLPNGTLGEFLVLFEYVITKQRPKAVLVAACFDDTREGPPRASVAKLAADPATAEALGGSAAGTRLLETTHEHDPARNPNQATETADTAGLGGTVQQRVENRLNDVLDEWLPLWRHRANMRFRLELAVYKSRNRLLGITPQSKRRVIPPRYAQHMECLAELLETCRRQAIDCIVYIPPLRNDVETPYVPQQYATFKTDVEAACRAHGAAFHDLEDLVPGELWGAKQSTSGGGVELDFMHFQGPGHVLLAEALERLMTNRSPSGN